MLLLCLLFPATLQLGPSPGSMAPTPGPLESESVPSYTEAGALTPTTELNYTVLNAEFKNTPYTLFLVLQHGELGRLDCYSKDGKDKWYTWYKGGQELQSSEIRTNSLIVNGSNTGSAGSYQCSTPSPSRVVTFKIFIQGAEEEGTVTEEMEVSEGDDVQLNTTLNIYPIELIDYSLVFSKVLEKNMINLASYPELELKDDVVVSNVSMTLKYSIDGVTSDNHGLYKFVMRYGDRVKTVEIFLKITSPPQILSFSLLPQFVSKDEDIALTLEIAGYPPPDITWYHQPCCPQQDKLNINELINNPEEFRFYHLLNDEEMLTLVGGLKKFNGSFWFEAENKIGSVVSEVTQYKIRGYGITIDSGSETNISRQVEYENVGSLRMTCIVNTFSLQDTDAIDITWYHNGIDISNTSTSLLTVEADSADGNIRQILQVDTPGLSDAGVYNCVARTNYQTLWSFSVDVEIVKQPIASVSPKVYEASAGATVVFSCTVDNIDGERGVDWDVQYRVRQAHQQFRDVRKTYQGVGEERLLYIPSVDDVLEVRCEPTPDVHKVPRYSLGKAEIVDQPPVTVDIDINRKRYTEGETLVIRCVMTSRLPAEATPRIFWKHEESVIRGPADGVSVLQDGTVVERYFTRQDENRTTEVLFIENMSKINAGRYTCIFDAGENGRYEDYYEITVHPKTPLNAISLIIAISFVFIVVIVMAVVLACVVKRSREHSYCVADKQIPDTRDLTKL